MGVKKYSAVKENLRLFFVILFLSVAHSAFGQIENEPLFQNGKFLSITQCAIEEKKAGNILPDAGGDKISKTIKNDPKNEFENKSGDEEKAPDFDRRVLDRIKFEPAKIPPPNIVNPRKTSKENNSPADDSAKGNNNVNGEGFDWKSAFKQSLLFLSVQHGFAFTQRKTRRELKGNFFKDYIKSIKNLRGWDDRGKFFTNYIAHPMQGSLTGFIMIQNDPKSKKIEFENSKDYWASRLKALAWSAAWSTQFELGPLSQASIGNIGFHNKQAWVDIVVTPTVGWTLLVSEDYADKHWIRFIERKGFYPKVFSRTFLNPTRAIANILRFKVPWYRDNR